MLTAISIEREAGSKALVRVGDELPSCRSQWGLGVGHRHMCEGDRLSADSWCPPGLALFWTVLRSPMKFSHEKWGSTSLGTLFRVPPRRQRSTQAPLVYNLEESPKGQNAR